MLVILDLILVRAILGKAASLNLKVIRMKGEILANLNGAMLVPILKPKFMDKVAIMEKEMLGKVVIILEAKLVKLPIRKLEIMGVIKVANMR